MPKELKQKTKEFVKNYKKDLQLSKACEIIKEFMRITECIEGFEPDYSELINNAEAFIKEESYCKQCIDKYKDKCNECGECLSEECEHCAPLYCPHHSREE